MKISPRIPTPRDAAILVLLLIQNRGEEQTSRVRLSEMTLRRLWGRRHWPDEFIDEVREWLFRSGWTLFYAGQSYGLVRTSIVNNWPRVSSKRLANEIEQVRTGKFDFESYADLVDVEDGESDD
jgi:hypothetical protein